MDPMSKARREVIELERPVHGGLGWRYKGVEDFSSNLNPYGPPPELREYILEGSEGLDHYPDDSAEEFLSAVAEHHHVDVRNTIAGAGTAELIRLFPETFIERGDIVVIPAPTFSEYSFACRLMGAKIEEVLLREDNGLRIDLERLRLKCKGAKAVYLCNPNNPTGNILRKREVLELAQEFDRTGTLLFLDETLLDLVRGGDTISCAKEATDLSNMFVIRSLTKSFAMPGMRIGYGIGSERMIATMSKARLSWNLGRLEQHVGARLITECQGHVRKAAEMMAKEGPRMAKEINGTGMVEAKTPESFFFFSRCKRLKGAEVQSAMLSQGVLVRDCASFGHPFDRFVRFAVRTPEKNDILISAFRKMAEESERR
ncbi:MAG: histidinol-phosphate aminotransferase family protein [Methanomassiliicoccales archaeon]|nr:MAG: histidinol-phosphate aminotransferase family protein [Methanomassiliicoccales archaeon]